MEETVVKPEEGKIKDGKNRGFTFIVTLSLLLMAGSSGFLYWKISQTYIYTDKVTINAPSINLAPQNSGILQEILVHVGDTVNADTVVARVDNELIKTKTKGVIISTSDNVGKIFNRGETVVSMLDPEELRVVARVDEDKGL